jgi:hypothetical protein
MLRAKPRNPKSGMVSITWGNPEERQMHSAHGC